MSNLPLIMQNITAGALWRPAPAVTEVNTTGVLKTGRGSIVALGGGFVGTGAMNGASNLKLQVDGIQIIENEFSNNLYLANLTTNQNRLFSNIFFTKYNEGASYKAEMNLAPTIAGGSPTAPQNEAGFFFAMYEGFKFFNPKYGEKFRSYNRMGFTQQLAGNEVPPGQPLWTLRGTLPKNRGKIVGFQIGYTTQGSPNDNWVLFNDYRPLNFSINGVTIIENVPAYYFNPFSGSHKDFYFDEPIEGGQEFEMTILFQNISLNGCAGVTFFFEN